MGRYALVNTETGLVNNVIEYDGSSPFNPGTGMELREAEANAEIGGTWNGSEFVRAVVPEVPADEARIRLLIVEVTLTEKFDEDLHELDSDGNTINDGMIDKTADEIAAEKTELLALLHAALVDGDLDQRRTQMMLRLERG